MEEDNTPKKTGPKPKQIVEATIKGYAIGRNKTVVPPEGVQELAAIGCTDKEIAAFYDVKEETLRYNFKAEIAKGRQYQKTRLRRNMFRAADNLNPAVMIFLAKNILGMSDSPIDSEANAPLPWNESEEDDQLEIPQEEDENEID